MIYRYSLNLSTSLYTSLHKIYFIIALPIVLCLVFLTPPFQSPDENNHFYRLVQIAQGDLVSYKKDAQDAGGDIPTGIVTFSSNIGLNRIPFHSENNMDLISGTHAQLASLTLNQDKTFVPFSNTALYSPLTYLPGALGFLIYKTISNNVVASYYTSRLANALVALLLVTLAIKYISRGKYLAFALLLMPMTLYQFASVSQDAIIIAYSALAVAMMNVYLDKKTNDKSAFMIMLLFLFFITTVASNKPPYVPLIFIFPAVFIENKKIFITSILTSLIACFFVAKWHFIIKPIINMNFQVGVDVTKQIDYLMNHMTSIPNLIWQTYVSRAEFYYKSFIGILGWLDTLLPLACYKIFYYGILLIIGLHLKNDLALKSKLMILILFLGTIFLIFLSQYIIWTPVAAYVIEGVQGRYFIPATLFLTLLLGQNIYFEKNELLFLFPYAMIALITCFVIADVGAIFQLIFRFYYG